MFKKLIAIAVGSAFALNAMPEGKGMLPKYSFDKEHVKSWSEEGKKAGVFSRDAFSLAEHAVMDMLLSVAEVIAGTPSQEDFLTGYALAWSNADTAKSRKTDARAVFEAFSRKASDAADADAFEYERIVGYEKNDDGSTKKDEKQMPIAIKETKTASDWLRDYEGDFKGFLSLAREIRNAGSGRQSQGTTADHRARKKVTDKQFSGIIESLPVASANQAHAIVAEATKQLAKMPQFELIILNEMELLANHLKTSKQPIYLEAAAKIVDVLNDLRDEVRKAADMQKAAAANVAGKPVSTAQGDLSQPQPAVQQQKAA